MVAVWTRIVARPGSFTKYVLAGWIARGVSARLTSPYGETWVRHGDFPDRRRD